MLKSRGRTDEISVMEMEEWPQVNYNSFNIILLNTRISSMSKKGHYPQKGVMPCAENKAGTKR